MASVRGDLIMTELTWSREADKSQDAILVFRRSDNRKRVNICGRRYAFDERKLQEIICALSPLGAWLPEGIEAEIDGDGDISRLTIPRRSTSFGGGTQILGGVTVEFHKPAIPAPPADIIAYQQCIDTVVKQRAFIANLLKLAMSPQSSTLVGGGILIPFFEYSTREMIDPIAVHYRKIFELLMYACWAAFEPRMELSYDTWQIRNVFEHLKRVFPNRAVFMVPVYAGSFLPIPQEKYRTFRAAELIDAYKSCGDALHTSTPYRRPFDDLEFLQTASEWNKRLDVLMALHRVQIEKNAFVFCRARAGNETVAWIDKEIPMNIPAGTLDCIRSGEPRHR
jgi:hypothetical protein